MTKPIKVLAIVMAITLILIFISGSLYLQQLSRDMNNAAAIYNAKKNELLLKQQSLETIIFDLNNTLSVKKADELSLSNQLTSLTNGNSQSNAISQQPPQAQPPQRIVTRAS